MAQVHLKDGRTIEVDDSWDKAAVDRAIAAFKAQGPAGNIPTIPDQPQQPQVPTGDPVMMSPGGPLAAPSQPVPVEPLQPWGETSTATGDPSATDPWATYLGKQAGSVLRGTAVGGAKGVDYMYNTLADVPTNTYRSFTSNAPYSPDKYLDVTDQPFTKAVERYLPNQPQGSQYEETANLAETYGPAAVAVLGTGGAGLFRNLTSAGARQTFNNAVTYPTLRAARDVAVGEGGATVGGGIGEQVGGERGRVVGQLLGGVVAPGVAAKTAKEAMRIGFTNDRSLAILQAVERVNDRLRAAGSDYQIPATFGLVGRRNMGTVEDITGRGVFSGGPALESRRDQYGGMEAGIQDVAGRTRSTSGGSVPAGGHITPESLGNDISDMAVLAEQRANNDINRSSADIANAVGVGAPLDPTFIENRLFEHLNNPNVGEVTKDNARAVLAELQRHYPPASPSTHNFPPPPSGSPAPVGLPFPLPGTTAPSFGAIQDFRRDVGKTATAAGDRISGEMRDVAYAGTTEAMADTAARQGALPEWQQGQREIRQSALDREAATEISQGGPKNQPLREKEAYNKVFSGAQKKAYEQLEPFQRMTPDELRQVMGDNLELMLRGETNAGLPHPLPESFNLENIKKNWSDLSDETKNAYVHNNQDLRRALDDIATVAGTERIRPGKRTVPGATGSTIGATAQILSPAILGAVLHGGGGALAGPPLMSAANYALGRVLTNPQLVNDVIRRTPMSIANMLGKAVAGATAGAANVKMDADRKRRQEEESAKYNRSFGGG